MTRLIVVHPSDGILLCNKMEQTTDTQHEESREHYSEYAILYMIARIADAAKG